MTDKTEHTVTGPCGLAQRETFRDALLQIVETADAQTVALNLTGVSETDAATLQMLISTRKSLAERGVALAIEPSADLITTAGRAGYELGA